MNERLEFTCDLARKVGQEALRFWQQNGVDNLGAVEKGLQDFVTIADKAAEATIRNALAEKYPEDGFLGEESGGDIGNAGYWVVDPIDGTANYLRGLRHWGVSIAYVLDGETVLGVVHDSPTDRIYAATLNGGATCEGKPIAVSNTSDPHKAVGILGASRRTPFSHYLSQLQTLFDAGIEHRKIGSAAIGIVRAAEGVCDFYYEKHLNSWDALAAALIAQEAGAKIVVPQMDQFISEGGEVLCCTPLLANQITGLLIGQEELNK